MCIRDSRYHAWQNICSIDGGCQVKTLYGQLNALILPNGDPSLMQFASYDQLPVAAALDAQECSGTPRSIIWGADRHQVKELKREDDFVLVRQLLTGLTLWVFQEHLYTYNGQLCCSEATDYAPEIRPGDTFSLMRQTSRGYMTVSYTHLDVYKRQYLNRV